MPFFVDDDKLKHSKCEELRRFSKEFHATGVQHLTQKWKECVGHGDLVAE
jgi:hypothetical protein